MLASENKQKVLVLKCPTDNKEQKQFLGYEWSSAKGNEGIKYINQSNVASDIEDAETKEMVQKTQGLHNINTPLYNPSNRNDINKINHYIQQNFSGNELPIIENLNPIIAYHNLTDMLEFSRVSFNKQIQLSAKKRIVIQSKFELVKIGDLKDSLEFINGFAFKSEEFRNKKTNTDELPVIKIGNITNENIVTFENDCQYHNSKKNIDKIVDESAVPYEKYAGVMDSFRSQLE